MGTITQAMQDECGLNENVVVATGLIDAHAGALALLG